VLPGLLVAGEGDGAPAVAAVGGQEVVDPVQGVRFAGEAPGLGGAITVAGLSLDPPGPVAVSGSR